MFAISNLVLGTAQLGMEYGIANKTGMPDPREIENLIALAWDRGIREFDTASAYGESEKVLGKALQSLKINNAARIITKPPPQLNHLDGVGLGKSLERSLELCGCGQLYCCMLHREDFLDKWNAGLGEILTSFVEQGKVRYLGVSVYSPQKALQALQIKEINFIQLPYNLLDGRFREAGVFSQSVNLKKTIYVRSIFLQGLLLMRVEDLPRHMEFARPVVLDLDRLAEDLNLTRVELAIGYLTQTLSNEKVVFGAESTRQVADNCRLFLQEYPDSLTERVRLAFSKVENRVINPTSWQ